MYFSYHNYNIDMYPLVIFEAYYGRKVLFANLSYHMELLVKFASIDFREAQNFWKYRGYKLSRMAWQLQCRA